MSTFTVTTLDENTETGRVDLDGTHLMIKVGEAQMTLQEGCLIITVEGIQRILPLPLLSTACIEWDAPT